MPRLVLPIFLLCLLALPACRVGGYSKPERENEVLRRSVKELQERNALLAAERDEARAKLAEVARAAPSAPSPEVLDATPVVVALDIDNFSTLTPTDPNLAPTGVIAYVRPLDGRRRFTQAVGTLTVQLWTDPLAPSPPRLIAESTLAPQPLRDAYRSSLLGTHYAVEFPLREPVLRSEPLTLRARFTDAARGREILAERPIIPPPTPKIGKKK